ncbi:Polysaccharide export outer membrane protein [hydrothermal vent metagenome]|uniref:Polysaccharide export outer membrane protein n=1 Tax=hydrothermal vent metagenome TaxID=652676 RepID=A0A1W1BHJ5_9ZZZZ
MKRVILYAIILINLTACSLKEEFVLFNQSPSIQDGGKAENLNRTMETTYIDSAKFEYKIRPHDRISIITYQRPELSTGNGGDNLGQGLLVKSNGTIRLPLINDIKIAGLTQPEAQRELEKRFKEYLQHPSIQVEVMNKRAFVLGEVNNPGPIELRNEQIPLLQLLSVAGDLTKGANRQSIMILKNYGDSVQTKIVSLTDVDSIATANQMIRPNDIVYVVPKGMSVFNNKVGEINPIFQLITNALTPFLTIRLLSQ